MICKFSVKSDQGSGRGEVSYCCLPLVDILVDCKGTKNDRLRCPLWC